MLIDLPLASVTVAELPLAARAPPFAAVQAESIIAEPSNWIVGPPEIRNAGQPLRPFGHEEYDGSSRTTLYVEPAIAPFTAVDAVATSGAA